MVNSCLTSANLHKANEEKGTGNSTYPLAHLTLAVTFKYFFIWKYIFNSLLTIVEAGTAALSLYKKVKIDSFYM